MRRLTTTHTTVLMLLTRKSYYEISDILIKAGYNHVFNKDKDGVVYIDMTGISIQPEPEPPDSPAR